MNKLEPINQPKLFGLDKQMLELVKALCNKSIYDSVGNIPVTAFDKEPKRIVEAIICTRDIQ
mgnify:CR=1 FL=1